MIEKFNVDSKAEYSALSSTRSQKKKKLKQTNVSAPLIQYKSSCLSVFDDNPFCSCFRQHQLVAYPADCLLKLKVKAG